MAKIVIIGGGIIGLSAAWELHLQGEEVVVLDARTAGMAASAANAGYIATSLPGPVPTPGLVKTSMKWMLDPESPLYIRPRADKHFLTWLYQFWRACTSPAYDAGLEASAALLEGTAAIMQRWQDGGIAFEMHDFGRLIAYQQRAVMEKDLAAYDKMATFGVERPEPMHGDALHEFEPALSHEITAAYYLKGENTVNPISLVNGLIARLESVGIDVLNGSPVVDIITSGDRVTAVRTPSELISADHVLIAAGAWSGEIGKMVGAKLPIQGGKGYALDFANAPAKPRRSISLRDAKIAVTPTDGGLRLSGTMELTGLNDQLNRRRIDAIHKAGTRFLNDVPAEPTHIRSGMRPMAPDGLPVIGRVSNFQNLTVATGHSMLGVTMAGVTAVHMANLIISGDIPDVIKPFSPQRFRGIL